MTIDKAIRYPVRKKYRGGGYDAGAGGANASNYSGGAMGGVSSPSGATGQGNYGQNNPNFGGNNNNQQQQQQAAAAAAAAAAAKAKAKKKQEAFDAQVESLNTIAKNYGYVKKNFNIDPDNPFSSFQVSGVPGSTPNPGFFGFDPTANIQDQINDQSSQNQQSLNDYSDLGYNFGNLTGTNALGLNVDSLAAQKLANANAIQANANAALSLSSGTAAQRLKDLQIGTIGDEETDRPSFMDNLASDFNAFTSDPLGSTARTLKSGIGSTLDTLTSSPLFGATGYGLRTLGNMFNTNYTQNEDGTISSSLTGALGLPDYTNLAGLASAKNLIGYDAMTEAEQEAAQQSILRDIVNFDDTSKGYSTDFSNVDTSLYNPGSDLAANAAAQQLADREGNRGPDNISQSSSSGGTGGGTGGGGTGGGDTGGGTGGGTGDDDSTTNNKTYTSEQERTMAYLGEMGYNRRYQEDYIDKDGVLFNFDEYDDIDFVS